MCHCETLKRTGNKTVKDSATAAVHKRLIYRTYLAMNHVECLVLDSVHSAHGATPARRTAATATGTVAVRRHLDSAAPRSTRANQLQLHCLRIDINRFLYSSQPSECNDESSQNRSRYDERVFAARPHKVEYSAW